MELLARAQSGLQVLGVAQADIDNYLSIIRDRLQSKQTGSQWQRHFIKEYNHDFAAMTQQYLRNQQTGKPVSEWTIK
jgi:hypothetical protein